MTWVEPETELEARIVADPRWRAGTDWGEPRPGHPEGTVGYHVREVLANLDRMGLEPETRRKLRLVAIVHDSFKREVDRKLPRIGANHHATIARSFLEQFTDDPDLLEIVELHDEAYHLWKAGQRDGGWATVEAGTRALLERLGPRLPLYQLFYRADNESGNKAAEPLDWFDEFCGRFGLTAP